jgi:cytochrome b
VKSVQVYNLPIRIFHWVFAICFILSFSIAKIVDDESIVYAIHMLSGLMMTFLVILRCLWGFFGSDYSTFKSMPLQLNSFFLYFKNITKKSVHQHVGHNPASSWLLVSMSVLTLFMTLTGVMMLLKINKHIVEDLHEVFSHLFLALVILHILGLLVHSLKFKDQIYNSMFSGKKNVANELEVKKVKHHFVVGYVFLFLILSFAGYLYKNFDQQSGTLSILSYKLPMVEVEDENNEVETDEHSEGED